MDRVDSQRMELREFHDHSFARIDARFDRIDERLDSLIRAMHAGFDKMDARFDQVEAAIIGRLEAKIEQRTGDLIRWSFVFCCGAVAGVAVLAGVLG